MDCVVSELPKRPLLDEHPVSIETPSAAHATVAVNFCIVSPVTPSNERCLYVIWSTVDSELVTRSPAQNDRVWSKLTAPNLWKLRPRGGSDTCAQHGTKRTAPESAQTTATHP